MKWRRLILWVLVVFVLDQLTKWWVMSYIPFGTSIKVIPNFFDLVHVTNRGAAFGILSTVPDPYRFIILLGVSVLAVVLILVYYASIPKEQGIIQIPLALILGGAAGNIFDRVVRGEVVDYLSFHWYNEWARWEIFGHPITFKLEWPAFNVADTAITCSVIWLMIQLLRKESIKA